VRFGRLPGGQRGGVSNRSNVRNKRKMQLSKKGKSVRAADGEEEGISGMD
jgi:hypothetical protein